jgi:hypothetical protein
VRPASGKSVTKWPPPFYNARVTLRAPLSFAFRWCTDYSSRDPELEKGGYQRKVLEKSRNRRVYEDLSARPTGWVWSRAVITLRPPDQWHDDEKGNYCDWSLDYQLTSLGPERTELVIQGNRRPTLLGAANPPTARFVEAVARAWKGFGRELERDYRSRARRPR